MNTTTQTKESQMMTSRSTRLSSTFAALCLGALLTAPGCATTDEPDPQDEIADDDSEIFGPQELDTRIAMPACGTPLASFRGVTAYSNGAQTGTGDSCAGWSSQGYGLQYQCKELVMRFFKIKYGIPYFRGHAKTLLAGARGRSGLEVWANGNAAHPPVPGDMLVWTGGTYGHVTLVTAVTGSTISMIEQNVRGTGSVTIPYKNGWVGIRPGALGRPAGWVHAKANRVAKAVETPWSCADSSYGGQQLWTCDGTALHRCEGGVPVEQACASGCNVNPLGTHDTCKSAAWSCEDSEYEGQQLWTCSGGALHRCTAGVPEQQACASGCAINPLGSDDVCR